MMHPTCRIVLLVVICVVVVALLVASVWQDWGRANEGFADDGKSTLSPQMQQMLATFAKANCMGEAHMYPSDGNNAKKNIPYCQCDWNKTINNTACNIDHICNFRYEDYGYCTKPPTAPSTTPKYCKGSTTTPNKNCPCNVKDGTRDNKQCNQGEICISQPTNSNPYNGICSVYPPSGGTTAGATTAGATTAGATTAGATTAGAATAGAAGATTAGATTAGAAGAAGATTASGATAGNSAGNSAGTNKPTPTALSLTALQQDFQNLNKSLAQSNAVNATSTTNPSSLATLAQIVENDVQKKTAATSTTTTQAPNSSPNNTLSIPISDIATITTVNSAKSVADNAAEVPSSDNNNIDDMMAMMMMNTLNQQNQQRARPPMPPQMYPMPPPPYQMATAARMQPYPLPPYPSQSYQMRRNVPPHIAATQQRGFNTQMTCPSSGGGCGNGVNGSPVSNGGSNALGLFAPNFKPNY